MEDYPPPLVAQAPGGLPNDPTIPDLYADGVVIQAGFAGFALTFTLTSGTPVTPRPIALIRLSPQMASLMSSVLGTTVKNYEDQVGKILLPSGIEGEVTQNQEGEVADDYRGEDA